MGHKGSKELHHHHDSKNRHVGIPLSNSNSKARHMGVPITKSQYKPAVANPPVASPDFIIQEESEDDEKARCSGQALTPRLSMMSSRTSAASVIPEESEEEEAERSRHPLVSIDTPTPPQKRHISKGVLYLETDDGPLGGISIVDDENHASQNAIYARIKPKSKRPMSIPSNFEYTVGAPPALPDRRYSCDSSTLHNLLRNSSNTSGNGIHRDSRSTVRLPPPTRPLTVSGYPSGDPNDVVDLEDLRRRSLAANNAPSPIEEDDFVDASMVAGFRTPVSKDDDDRLSMMSSATAYERTPGTPTDTDNMGRKFNFTATPDTEDAPPPMLPLRGPLHTDIQTEAETQIVTATATETVTDQPSSLPSNRPTPTPLKKGKRSASYMDALGTILQESHV
eukprot:m.53248 g.53248  ORF g.53248 m.53248 type:complete len:394 (-) comp21731_c1_seq1:80-1261(-)